MGMSAFLNRISWMNLRRFRTAGSSSAPSPLPENSSSSIELAQVAVARDAQDFEALFLYGLRERADAQTRGVLGAIVLVDDDDGKAETRRHGGLRIGAGQTRKARSVGLQPCHASVDRTLSQKQNGHAVRAPSMARA